MKYEIQQAIDRRHCKLYELKIKGDGVVFLQRIILIPK